MRAIEYVPQLSIDLIKLIRNCKYIQGQRQKKNLPPNKTKTNIYIYIKLVVICEIRTSNLV